MKRSAKLKVMALLISAALVAAAGALLIAVHGPFEWRLNQARMLIVRIDEHRERTGRLPDGIEEIEPRYETEAGPVYYQKMNDDAYIVWIGLSLGESYVFDSQTRKWR